MSCVGMVIGAPCALAEAESSGAYVRVVAAQPGHEARELTKPDIGPIQRCPGQVVPEVAGQVLVLEVRGLAHVSATANSRFTTAGSSLPAKA